MRGMLVDGPAPVATRSASNARRSIGLPSVDRVLRAESLGSYAAETAWPLSCWITCTRARPTPLTLLHAALAADDNDRVRLR
jgi:hypothetical protein